MKYPEIADRRTAIIQADMRLRTLGRIAAYTETIPAELHDALEAANQVVVEHQPTLGPDHDDYDKITALARRASLVGTYLWLVDHNQNQTDPTQS